jgi:hypothetical protein
MHISIQRKNIKFLPDNTRIVARFFDNGELRTRELLKRVITLKEVGIDRELEHTLREFAGRHRNISQIFMRHFELHRPLIEEMGMNILPKSETAFWLLRHHGIFY